MALPDPSTPFGAAVRERLAVDKIIWLTTIGKDGTPQPNPVWFLFEGDTILTYNRSDANRLNHIKARPRVALNLNQRDGDVVVLIGTAERADDLPPSDRNDDYLAKYDAQMARVSGSPAKFAAAYPVPMRITIESVRGF
ncbi:MAG TPA: TIGR03667 family PPOX class F420-dependent oxidoreductase [Pseudonocardiaceae bacterium]|jgi:PPOX class probable F420-dependent enzyme|nr:TIGR03667 family PPOX class F420-dependent oxidoreductase [Pseudonocardiaceae bacterium]